MKVHITNNTIEFDEVPLELVRELDRMTAPVVKGHRYNRAFQQGLWDGREHMVKRKRKGGYTAPVGLLPELLDLAEEWGVEVDLDDARRSQGGSIETDWNPDWVLRGYQREAIEAACADNGLMTGKGLLRLPTRSGKTVIAAGIIDRLKVKTLFLVQSEMLLAQTISLFETVLRVPVGKVGGGDWRVEDITVASCQTLSRRAKSEEVKDLLDTSDLVIFDECHHLEGKRWREVLEACDAPYKVGLSATIYFDLEGEVPKGSIWMKAATGGVLYSMEPSDLIRMGYLIKPVIRLLRVEGKVQAEDYQEAYQLGIVESETRNGMVCDEARKAVEAGLSTLVVTNRLDHVEILKEGLEDVGLSVEVIIGATPPEERRSSVERFKHGEVDVLMGTVFGEGVDIPTIECVINAEGGQSKKATMQRFRNLTPAKGKTKALFIDFLDFHSSWLAKHSKVRLATYRGNPEFDIEVGGEDV